MIDWQAHLSSPGAQLQERASLPLLIEKQVRLDLKRFPGGAKQIAMPQGTFPLGTKKSHLSIGLFFLMKVSKTISQFKTGGCVWFVLQFPKLGEE